MRGVLNEIRCGGAAKNMYTFFDFTLHMQRMNWTVSPERIAFAFRWTYKYVHTNTNISGTLYIWEFGFGSYFYNIWIMFHKWWWSASCTAVQTRYIRERTNEYLLRSVRVFMHACTHPDRYNKPKLYVLYIKMRLSFTHTFCRLRCLQNTVRFTKNSCDQVFLHENHMVTKRRGWLDRVSL